MIVLHAIWSKNSQLVIWGEDASLIGKSRAQKPLKKALPKHPFACDREWLQEAIGQTGALLYDDSFNEAELSLLLPTIRDGEHLLPQASPQLPAGDGAKSSLILHGWRIPALSLAANDALDLLIGLPTAAVAGVGIGASLRYFSEVAKFALALTARGLVLPSAIKAKTSFQARWQPVIDDEADQERWRVLLRGMPPLCRAEFHDEQSDKAGKTGKTGKAGKVSLGKDRTENNGRSANEILRDIVEQLVDTTVRGAIVDHQFFPAKKRGRVAAKSVSERWVIALKTADAGFDATNREFEELQSALDQWRAGIAVGNDPLRLCFRLSTPDNEHAPWRLDFLLQAVDDKSLLVAADAVWQTKGDALNYLNRRLVNPQERLLESLGRAAQIYPALDESLKTARPTGLELKADGAYQFLREGAPLLEQAHFGMLIPNWWQKPAGQLGVKLRVSPSTSPSSVTKSLLDQRSLVNYQWEISLGEEKLNYADFKRLAKLKMPLVQVRGQWVALKKEEIERALKFFEKREFQGEMSVIEALRISSGLETNEVGLPVLAMEAQGWLETLFEANDNALKSLPPPPGFKGSLRPYQQRGLAWLAFMRDLGLGACLADDMGLGKTVQLLALLLSDPSQLVSEKSVEKSPQKSAKSSARSKSVTPSLLICPMSVVGNWQRETARFAPQLKVHVHHGAKRLTGEAFAKTMRDIDLVITTYNLAARDEKILGGIKWRYLVLDEAQNIKNSATKQTQAINRINAERRAALTGTPVENRLSELWSIMSFLNPGLLNSASDFRTRFAVPIERYRDEEKAKILKRLTSPFILRRLKTDKSIIADLPDKIEMKMYCNLTREQASLYQAVVDEMMEKIEKSEGIERKGLVLATMVKLKQVCNHPAQLLQDRSELPNRSGKLARLEELLEEALANNDRVLCFTQFAELGHMLKAHLQERFAREVLFLYGGSTKRQRDDMVTRFQSPNGPPIFLLSIKAGGTGLNLTAANQVIHFDRWWNPAVEDQATDRAFRIGQKQNVQVRKFICVGTLEERIDQMIEQKKELADRIVGSGESWLTEFSTKQLRELIALTGDAVAES